MLFPSLGWRYLKGVINISLGESSLTGVGEDARWPYREGLAKARIGRHRVPCHGRPVN